MGEQVTKVAVIGLGPRGVGALEALAERMRHDPKTLTIDVFDPSQDPGAGPNFQPDESPLCLLNIPMRDIDIRPPSFSSCGRFGDWLGHPPPPDSFPTRADLGRYLEARLRDLMALDALPITCHATTVTLIRPCTTGWELQVADRWLGPYHEVLLTLGQPETEPDDQLAEWQSHVQQVSATLAQAYPARALERQASAWSGKRVAIRGLGLSAYDVYRALTTAQGGVFEGDSYRPSGREPEKVIAFSLDGHAPFPKPETTQLDAVFDPLASETKAFAAALDLAVGADPERAARLINQPLAETVARVLTDALVATQSAQVSEWLQIEWEAPATQETGSAHDILERGIALAEGTSPPTVGYATGQVWRKWQDTFRAHFNPADVGADTAKAIVGFDEGLKRYSYGPPVASAREMRALVAAGVIDLTFAADPKIATSPAGWTLKKGAHDITVSVMIDAVLPSPLLSQIVPPLLPDLMQRGILHPVGDGLAAHTAQDGQVVNAQGQAAPGLCLLGRLALGSVVAVDSLHDCFGEATHRWAAGVVDRINQRS